MKQSKLYTIMSLLKFIHPMILPMILAIIFGVLGFLCAISLSVLGAYGLLSFIQPVSYSFSFIIFMMFLCAILRGLLRYGEQALNHFIAFKLLAHIRDQIFKVLRTLAPAKLECKEKGALISLITSDIELLEVFFAHTISPVLIALIVSLFLILFLSSYHVIFGLIALVAYAWVGILLPIKASKQSQDYASDFREKNSQLNNFVLESLYGFFVILQYENQKKRLNQLDELSEQMLEKEKALKETTAKNVARTSLYVQGFSLLMLGVGIGLYVQGKGGFEIVLIPFVTLFSSFGPVLALANLGTSLQPTLAAASRVLDLLNEKPLIEEVSQGIDCEFENAQVENISFQYDQALILDQFSLDINKGQLIGIQGKSGSGKSTLLKLLMRFWDVNQGQICISSHPIQDINTSNLRNMESYMTQDTYLFHDTIENNLRVAKIDATLEEIHKACKKASIHDFIMGLEKGYQSVVGERGTTLSGGERQRIGLARAFLHEGDLMLLDEPSSNLDSLNEAIFLKALKKESKKKTIVLVSHRLSTLKIADEMITFETERAS